MNSLSQVTSLLDPIRPRAHFDVCQKMEPYEK